MKLVLIEWEDSYSYGGWHARDSGLDIVAACVSMGLLIDGNDNQVTIAQSMSKTSGNIGDTITIPKGCIKRMRTLKVVDQLEPLIKD